MRFCPNCGGPLMAGAKFCVECGRPLGDGASEAGASGIKASLRKTPISATFIGVFVAIALAGLAAAGWIILGTPSVVRRQVAAENPAPGNMPPAQNSMEGAAGGTAPGQLPQGHPHVELPTEARTYIDKLQHDAKARPDDIAAWNKLGATTMRAAMFDPSYYPVAEKAYAHALKLDPDNLDALRGMGDIYYDHNQFDEAIAAYEHFLKKKPDDPEVRTDLGTMYLYTGNADQAVVQYKRAVKVKPDFFQAYYNLGVAYAENGKRDDAIASLGQAMKLAPDDNARKQVNQLIQKIGGKPILTASAGAGAAASPAASSAGAAPSGAAHAPATTFHGEIEQLVRNMPIAGPRVGSVQWTTDLKGRVLMNNFPMDSMPPNMKQKFLGDIKSGIATAKKDHKISGQVELDMVDGASGRVMETVTQ
jgi:cytochrome c-type biogenesis protein CcmH/NrfG